MSGGGQNLTGQQYNQNLQRGTTHEQMRTMRTGPGEDAPLLYNFSPNQWNDITTQAGMQSPTGRPLAGSAQFYQPVYQPQFQDYNMGNPMSISQYGQQQFGGFMPQMQTPFRQPMQQQFNPYANNFGGGFGGGFMPQQQFMPQMQTPIRQPTNNFGGGFGGFSDMMYRPDMRQQFQPQFMPQQQFMPQMQQFMPQMQTPFQQPMQQAQSPFRSSGPSQPIVGRSSQMRGTPNVMRRAEGGITSLMDEA
jgi:hypothetical protein